MSLISNQYHANGKLLVTGEYFILDGAVGLALPTKFGQSLTVESSENKGISWRSIDNKNNIWFEAAFSEELEIISSSNDAVAKTLQNILSHCALPAIDCRLSTKLDFPQDWGLGSSSTLISLLAQWCNIDPYELLAKTFDGSGYDIACATANQPITYQKTSNHIPKNIGTQISNSVNFHPVFKENLYFVHLGKKQNSREGIQHYRNLKMDKKHLVRQISDITQEIIQAETLDEFNYYLELHEDIISDALNLPKVKEIYFRDFPGKVKSLGAWGGDFVLAAGNESSEIINNYFQQKGFSTVLPYSTIIL